MIVIIIILIIILLIFSKRDNIENYHDITPYDFHWDIFKCYDGKCLRSKAKKCYDWCNHWGETGGRHNCRMRCLDYADQQADYMKLHDVIWNRNMPKFKHFTLNGPRSDWL